ncbi:E3 ubiquitin-protein ligase synoviolin B-like [Brevipalpus obovatus]|uniref:E3 ubiquitin-protein ligase synoviolin B-like n=1 Tax=Brevipalpus obovatus TaxID=246614 RepID=UPI003D9ED558
MKTMKALLVTVTSIVLTSAVLGNAYFQKKQFYPSVVYIIKSNPSMAVIYFQAFVFVLLMGKLMRKIFFGQLRAAEMEHLIERAWYAVTETCLAFTVFRDDLSPKFVALFTLLLFLKCFHWLAEDRVDFMERSPNISFLFHFRVISLLSLLGSLDISFVNLAYHSTLSKGASVQLVFGFEYAILFTAVINILLKYGLHCLDLRRENPWENKAVCLLYTELLMGLLKVLLYLAFIVIMMKIHTFPLFAIRPMYLSIRALKKALNDVIMSRRAIRNMNTLYPNATTEDLVNNDNICIICREEMTSNGTAKKLPCNHIFHISCLRSWFQRQQTCPTCRMDVLRTTAPSHQARPQPAAAAPQPNQPLLAPQVQMLFAPLLANLANNMHLPNQNPNQLQPGQPGASQQAASGSAGPSSTSTSANSSASPSATSVSSSIPAASSASVSTHVLRSVLALPGFVPFVPLTQSTTASSPPNLSSLSDDELRRMEGTEREAIESRIRVLLNVKSLLDSAVAQLNQYQMVAGPISVNINNHSDGSTLRTGAKEGEPKQEPSEEKKERDTVITKRRVATQTNEDSGVDQFKSVKSKASTQERG